MWRYHSLTIERDRFGIVRLVRNWGRIGTKGQELVEIHANGGGKALAAIAQLKRRRGYRVL
ncbi:WGR domain-containing protein [Microvirga sp. VF16]|uniref:WGR domain-containing protein n=1 Tax=Microvirga sp. VF16 TaxID=2807101 RepID=UPI0035301CE1